MGKRPEIDKNGLKKGPWSQEEDDKLRAYIMRYGHWNWRQLPKFAGLSRCGKSCRLRWLNYLRANVKRGNFTKEEGDLIMELRGKIGNKWSVIAAQLPGRTDNEIKNYWHSHLKKLPKQNQATSEVIDQCNDTPQFGTNSKVQPSESFQIKDNQEKELVQEDVGANVLEQQAPENHSIMAEPSSAGPSSISFDYPFLNSITGMEEDSITSIDKYSRTFENFWTEPFLPDESYNHDGGFMSSHYPYFDDAFDF